MIDLIWAIDIWKVMDTIQKQACYDYFKQIEKDLEGRYTER